MKRMRPSTNTWSLVAAGMLLCVLLAAGCSDRNPDTNTPTSGRLTLFVDDIYAPVFRALADSFQVIAPDAKIEIRPASARQSVQSWLDAQYADTSTSDTATVTALIIGRRLLEDEQKAIASAALTPKEYLIGYDGVAVIVPGSSNVRYVMLGGLRSLLATGRDTVVGPDTAHLPAGTRFALPDQNSSTLAGIRGRLLPDSGLGVPGAYLGGSDSVVASVAGGEGAGIVSAYRAAMDTPRVRMLPVGWIDSLGNVHNPAYVHPATLVTDAYPLKQPVVGFTFASERTLAVGFLAWLTASDIAQRYLAFTAGMQPVAKLRLVMPGG